jgi:hypothetical protein
MPLQQREARLMFAMMLPPAIAASAKMTPNRKIHLTPAENEPTE